MMSIIDAWLDAPLSLAALIACLAWLFLLVGRHGFWTARQRLGRPQQDLVGTPSVIAIVPARNEADHIEQVISALSAMNYPGDLKILLVDDQSTDATAANAKKTALYNLRVVRTQDPPHGWTGKLWALQTGLDDIVSRGAAPDYLWLTDADIVHGPEVLTALVTKAQARQSALTSLMVRLNTAGFWGALTIPAFVYFFQLIYPFGPVNSKLHGHAGAAGGCILLKPEALIEIGGFAALKSALIDDCTLAKHIKRAGHAIWLGHGTASASLRDNRTLGSVWSMVRRTAYAQLGYNPLLLVLCLAGLVLTFFVPVAALIAGVLAGSGKLLLLGAFSSVLMLLTAWPTWRLYGRMPLEALFLPFTTALYGAMTVHSAWAHIFGQGNSWKGRSYGSGTMTVSAPTTDRLPRAEDSRGDLANFKIEDLVDHDD